MERVSELIMRNAAQLPADDLLLFNAPPDNLFRELGAAGRRVLIWSQDFGDHRWFMDSGADAGFGVLPDPGTVPAQILLFQPREKERLELLLHFFAASIPANGCLWLVGENASGIKSSGKRLGKYFSKSAHADSARHCVLFYASQPAAPVPFQLEKYQQKWLLGVPPDELRMVSLPGAFAHGRLDRGTELLLEVLLHLQGQRRPGGSVLDFGCGIGVIGLSLLRHDPSINLTLLDNSALALESARLSLQANALTANLLPSNGLTEVRQRFDWIVSNPPFHRGVATRSDIAQDFFQQAHHVLTRQGKLLLVCNRHLPYEGWLVEQFSAVDTLHSTNEFKVLCASRPKT
jgi:16S rRNA (guanine1207-N2)-methyltransferase